MARIFLRIDLVPKGRIGPGKIALLEQIALAGSISAAGRALGMSYRRAWLLVDELNRLFGAPVVTTQLGGSHGGGSALSDQGDRWALLNVVPQKSAVGVSPSINRSKRLIKYRPQGHKLVTWL